MRLTTLTVPYTLTMWKAKTTYTRLNAQEHQRLSMTERTVTSTMKGGE